jgi:hypothetical protein
MGRAEVEMERRLTKEKAASDRERGKEEKKGEETV